MTGTGTATGCVFCEAQTGEQADLIVFRGRTCFIILNKFPYNNGHLMVIPNRHVASLAAATSEELCERSEYRRPSEEGAPIEERAGAPRERAHVRLKSSPVGARR